MSLKISPSVGVARLGNSTTEICLSPDRIGGLPFDVDANNDKAGPITSFRDSDGLIKRQGQLFKVFDGATEIKAGVGTCTGLTWTVHLANKKGAWRQYSELDGNLLYGDENSYEERDVAWRNGTTVTEPASQRRQFLIDPGPRFLSGPNRRTEFNEADALGTGYPMQFPDYSSTGGAPIYGTAITTLGELRTDSDGNLIVLGGYGHSGGNEKLENYGGQNTWHDDISDGPVFCTVRYSDREDVTLEAWCIVGSPDFAPEIVNISNLSDTMYDVAVRKMGLDTDLYESGAFKTSYLPSYEQDILPILERMERYQWVANIQPMMTMGMQRFDYSDKNNNAALRNQIFSYFRPPNGVPPTQPLVANQPQQKLWLENNGADHFPTMPLNSGSNSVSNQTVVKFLALNETQYFFMSQWAAGNFTTGAPPKDQGIDPMDQAQVGNCVGLPMCPGIEVTWSLQNDVIYDAPYVIKQFRGLHGYQITGLDPNRDECQAKTGCEPGDLTKRMANPWQADFFQCTIQYINFTDPATNKVDGTPLPPTYYSYWWPPQSPWDVLVGGLTPEEQAATHVPMGEQMNYQRGINSFDQMIEFWFTLGFIRDLNSNTPRFPFIVETERLNEYYRYQDYPIKNITGNPNDQVTIPVFEVSNVIPVGASARASKLVEFMEKRSFQKVEIHEKGLPHPRRGTLRRR